MALQIIFAILFAIFLAILGYFVFYIVDTMKTFLRIMHKGEALLDALRRDQRLIEDIALRSQNTVEGIQAIVRTAEDLLEAGKNVKVWRKKKKSQ